MELVIRCMSTKADGVNMIVPTTVKTKRADTCTGHCFICGDSWMRGIAAFFFFQTLVRPCDPKKKLSPNCKRIHQMCLLIAEDSTCLELNPQ